MKTVLISIFSGALMLGAASAQGNMAPAPATPASNPQTSTPPAPRIAPGSVIPVSLTKTIDAKKVKTGDEVIAKVTQDMKTDAGEVVVPKDTKFVGHVTQAQARNKEQKESQVGITFDRAVLKNGSEIQMPMAIQAVIVQQNSENNSGGNTEAVPSGAGGYPSSARGGGMGGSTPSSAPRTATQGSTATGTPTGTNSRPQISTKTEGVIGIADLKLTSSSPAASQGSLLSSEKNNVKIESGTLMLLRVN